MSHNAPCLGACGVDERDLGVSELRGRLSSLLTLRPSSKQPLCLILDGLDHMEKTLWSEMVCSLPTPLPPNVKVVLTATSSARAPGGVALCLVSLPALERKQCVKKVASLLSSRGRRVTSGQQVLVNQALSSCCLPLYVQLLHRHTALWRSGESKDDISLANYNSMTFNTVKYRHLHLDGGGFHFTFLFFRLRQIQTWPSRRSQTGSILPSRPSWIIWSRNTEAPWWREPSRT